MSYLREGHRKRELEPAAPHLLLALEENQQRPPDSVGFVTPR
jgi:hypothetical protein